MLLQTPLAKYCQDCYDNLIEEEDSRIEKYIVNIVERPLPPPPAPLESIFNFKVAKPLQAEVKDGEKLVKLRLNIKNEGPQEWPDTTVLASVDDSDVFDDGTSKILIGKRAVGKLTSTQFNLKAPSVNGEY